ncbi:MAG: hypothetical protein EOM12_12750 [Verrucomicrobiae bacterium]|nr:hypothetical protein [Verrucomicrobiae bacterium]
MILQDEKAERALLGCIMYDPMLALDVCITRNITAESFAIKDHRAIYANALDMWQDKGACDLIALQKAVQKDGVENTEIIEMMLNECVTVAHAPHYANTVREYQQRRMLQKIGQRVVFSAAEDDVSRAIALAESALTEIHGNNTKTISVTDAAEATSQRWENIANGTRRAGIPSRFKGINDCIGGYTEYTILAARPAQGKSLLMLNEAVTMARAGYSVGIASVEMSIEQCLSRMACESADVNQFALDNGYSGPERLKRAQDEIKYIAKQKIHIDDILPTVDDVCTFLRMTHLKHGLDIAFVDYLQLLRSNEKHGSGNERVQYISSRLLHLRKMLKIPVVVLSQLSRECERDNRLPRLSDLRDSGAIEQDGHTILLLSSSLENPDNESICQIAKNRDGPTASVTLKKNFRRQRFEQ